MRDRQANGVDGLNIKPLWLLQKIPSAPGVVVQGGCASWSLRDRHSFPAVPSRRSLVSTRSRISAVAARVKVMARICSGSSTSASSFSRRRVSSSVFPERREPGRERIGECLECLRAGAFVDRLQQQFSHRPHPHRRRHQRGRSPQSGTVRGGRKIRRSWGTA